MTPAPVRGSWLSTWRPPRGCVGIVALGQAGFALAWRNELLLIDPFLSPRPDRLAAPVVVPGEVVGATVVLATHEHEDHLDLPAWAVIAQASPNAAFVVPEPLVPLVTAAGIERDRVLGAVIGSPIRLGVARVTAVPARHAVRMDDGYSLGDDPPRFAGYVVELGGVRVYHAGDTLADERIVRAVGPQRPEIALLPINGRDPDREGRGIVGNLSPDEAARMARDVGARLVVPMHFDTVRGNTGRPDAFVRAMRRRHPAASVWVPGPGAGLVWPGGGFASGPSS
jgi:L-ascorbate metabolism protein UlaG (beta-lactamase superfamily)